MSMHNQRKGGDALPRSGAASIALGAAVLLGAMAMAPMAAAEPPLLGPLTQISGPSPFGGCIADKVEDQEAEGSIVFHDSEVEPYVHVNPMNTDNVVAVWQQDRWNDGGSRGDIAAVSDDGGETWETVTPPLFTVCAGGIFERATDPWVSFGPDGTAYFMSLSFDSDPDIFGGHHAMQVSKSTDGGHTWDPPVTLIEENELLAFNDKNSLTADPTNANLVYGIWDRLELFEITQPQLEALSAAVRFEHDRVVMAGRRLQQMRAAAAAEAVPEPPEFKGPTYFTRSTDGGDTWELPHIIYDPGADNQTINNLVEVLPDGVIVALFTEILNTDRGVVVNIGLKRSFDQGFSFRPTSGRIRAQRIFTNAIANPTGTVTPDEQLPVRDAGILFDSAVDPSNGNLYLVWQDNRFNGVDQIAFSQSTDGGSRWSRPIKISQTPDNDNILRTQGFLPTVAVNSDGLVAVTYYDYRNDDLSGELADHWIILCDPGNGKKGKCSKARNWGQEARLTDMSFDIRDAPDAGGLFLGDYMGQANAGTDFLPVFGIADGLGQSSIFVRRATPTTLVSALPE
jgi:hypothetical protein